MMSFFFATVLFPSFALAQTTDESQSDGAFSLKETWVAQPTLNLAACAAEADEDVAVRLETTTALIELDASTLVAWLDAADDATCTGDVPDVTEEEYIGDIDLDADDTFLAGTSAITVPDDLEDDAGEPALLTGRTVLDLESACGGDGIETQVTLCMGLDQNQDDNIEPGDTVNPTEPHAWVRIGIDTIAPPKPDKPTVTPLDGKLRLGVSISADGAKDDVTEWEARRRALPDDPAAAGQPCDEWSTAELRTTRATATGAAAMTFTVEATNGVTTEVCVRAIDGFGNPGPFSDVASGTPQVECDFAECYPSDLLEPGCSAMAPGWGGLAAVVVLVRRRSRARGKGKGER